jgi:hypothetical protein
VQKKAQQIAGEIPIIPIPNGNGGVGVGVGTLSNVFKNKIQSELQTNISKERLEQLYNVSKNLFGKKAAD